MRITPVFITLIFNLSCFPQAGIDSLLQKMKSSVKPVEKANLYNALAEKYQAISPEKMQEYATKAIVLSKNNGIEKELAFGYLNAGASSIILGKYNTALNELREAETIFIKLKDINDSALRIGLIKCYVREGVIYSEKNNYGAALQQYHKALKIAEEYSLPSKLSPIHNNIGVIYQSINDNDKALEYFFRAHKNQKENKDADDAIYCTNIGKIYLRKNNDNKALEYFKLAEQKFKKHPDSRGLGELYNNLGIYYIKKKQLETAKSMLLKAKIAFESIENSFGISDTYYFLATIFYQEKNQEQALQNVNACFRYANELGLIETQMKGEKLLSDIFEQQGNSNKALIHLKKFNQFKDSLHVQENTNERIKAELNYEFKKKLIIEKESHTRNLLLAIFGIILFFLLLIGGYLYHKKHQAKNKISIQKDIAEYEHKALHLQMNPHFVFNCLASISSFIMQNGKEDAITYLAKFSKLMRSTLEYSKESFIPVHKEIESLQNYLELEQLRFNHKFNFSITKSPEIEDDTPFPSLLLQPYVENAIIHGIAPKKGKGNIEINFTQDDKNFICTIKDDGIGIDTSRELKRKSVTLHKSMALSIIEKRLEMLGIVSNHKSYSIIEELKDGQGTSKGTQIALFLPLNHNEEI